MLTSNGGRTNPKINNMLNPITFPEVAVEVAKDQEQYGTLPGIYIPGPNGQLVTCWKLPFWGRVKVLFTGVIWMRLLTFNRSVTPSNLSENKDELLPISMHKTKEPFYSRWFSSIADIKD